MTHQFDQAIDDLGRTVAHLQAFNTLCARSGLTPGKSVVLLANMLGLSIATNAEDAVRAEAFAATLQIPQHYATLPNELCVELEELCAPSTGR